MSFPQNKHWSPTRKKCPDNGSVQWNFYPTFLSDLLVALKFSSRDLIQQILSRCSEYKVFFLSTSTLHQVAHDSTGSHIEASQFRFAPRYIF